MRSSRSASSSAWRAVSAWPTRPARLADALAGLGLGARRQGADLAVGEGERALLALVRDAHGLEVVEGRRRGDRGERVLHRCVDVRRVERGDLDRVVVRVGSGHRRAFAALARVLRVAVVRVPSLGAAANRSADRPAARGSAADDVRQAGGQGHDEARAAAVAVGDEHRAAVGLDEPPDDVEARGRCSRWRDRARSGRRSSRGRTGVCRPPRRRPRTTTDSGASPSAPPRSSVTVTLPAPCSRPFSMRLKKICSSRSVSAHISRQPRSRAGSPSRSSTVPVDRPSS